MKRDSSLDDTFSVIEKSMVFESEFKTCRCQGESTHLMTCKQAVQTFAIPDTQK